jgi:NADH-quinone oxidoreductase subunit J
MEAAFASLHRQRSADGVLRFIAEQAMTATLLVFFILATLSIIGAVSLILQKHPIHSALSLIVVMVALAGLYLLMGAEFVAAVQIIVYGGAIMVLFVFVIMLLNAGLEEHTNESKLAGFPGILLALALMGFVAATVARSTTSASAVGGTVPGALSSTKQLSTLIFTNFVYPFELTSFLILIAILGAIVLAHRENS